jgi:hypothetical protein
MDEDSQVMGSINTNSTSNSAKFDQVARVDYHMEINDYNYLPTMILSSYRFDSTNVVKVFPIEIIYIILEYLSTPIIEFEYSEKTSTRHAKYHKGREYPYSIQTDPYLSAGTIPFINEFQFNLIFLLFSLHESIQFRSYLVSHFLRLGKDRKNKVFFQIIITLEY